MSASVELRPDFVLVVDRPDGVRVFCRDGVWRGVEDAKLFHVDAVSFQAGCRLVRDLVAPPSRPRLLHRRTVGL